MEITARTRLRQSDTHLDKTQSTRLQAWGRRILRHGDIRPPNEQPWCLQLWNTYMSVRGDAESMKERLPQTRRAGAVEAHRASYGPEPEEEGLNYGS